MDFPFYNSKGKASHTIEGMEREGKEKPKREGGGPGAMMFPFSCRQAPTVCR
jgi:hypothetical protein